MCHQRGIDATFLQGQHFPLQSTPVVGGTDFPLAILACLPGAEARQRDKGPLTKHLRQTRPRGCLCGQLTQFQRSQRGEGRRPLFAEGIQRGLVEVFQWARNADDTDLERDQRFGFFQTKWVGCTLKCSGTIHIAQLSF